MNQDRLIPSEDDAITDAAAHWCMRLHADDCSADERTAFNQWLGADPRHAEEYQAMLEIWQTADLLPRTANVLELRPAPRRARHWRPLASAAAIALLALPLAGWVGWEQGWLPSSYQHFESSDRLQQVTLSDGSVVELNLNSELRFLDYKDERRVTLVKGEAFFQVSHDSSHPFIVRAGNGQTRVTGTQFNVWKYQDQVKVTLVEGSVLVSSDGSHGSGYRLGPGMQASYRQGDFEPQLAQSDDFGNNLAWRSGKLVLDNLSLGQALPVINRYLEKPLRLADDGTARLRVSGIYNTTEVERLVDNLPKVLPVYLTRSKDGSTVLNRIVSPPARG